MGNHRSWRLIDVSPHCCTLALNDPIRVQHKRLFTGDLCWIEGKFARFEKFVQRAPRSTGPRHYDLVDAQKIELYAVFVVFDEDGNEVAQKYVGEDEDSLVIELHEELNVRRDDGSAER